MKVLVIGAGMYVTGRSGTGPGTVLAAIAQFSRAWPVEQVTVAARSMENAVHVAAAGSRINALLGSRLAMRYEQLTGERSLEALLAQGRFDCAIVAVPDHVHHPIARVLLENRVPCLVVKPLAPTLAEARALAALARERACYGAVEFHKRFDEANLYARKAVDGGVLGRLLYVTVDYSQRISIPTIVFREWAERTNIFQYLAVHYVDLIHFLTGFLPTRAMAVGTHGILKQRGMDIYDSIHATIMWRNPADPGHEMVSQFATNWIDPERSAALSDQKYKIVGTAGRIELDQTDRGVKLVTADGGMQAINPYFAEFLPQPEGGHAFTGYGYRSIERFLLDVRDLAGGRTELETLERTRPTFRSALPATAVIEAVNASLAGRSEWESIREIF